MQKVPEILLHLGRLDFNVTVYLFLCIFSSHVMHTVLELFSSFLIVTIIVHVYDMSLLLFQNV